MANVTNPTLNWKATCLNEEWKKFQQHCELMFAGPLKKATKEERAAYVLIWVGSEGREIYNSWTITADQGRDYNFLFEQFRKHTAPQTNTVFSRYIFHTRKQKDDELFVAFATDLRILVKDCKYDKPDEMVRDRIVAGITNDEIRGKLLTEGDQLTMDKAIQIATTYEITQAQLKSMATGSKLELDFIKKGKKKSYSSSSRDSSKQNGKENDEFMCKNCGSKHGRKACKAFGEQCNWCLKYNHFENSCLYKKKGGKRVTRTNKKVHVVEEDSEDDDFFIGSIEHEEKQNTAFANIEL